MLIDSWGFTLRVAQGVRAAAPHIKLVKYIGPQVWATRPGRAKTLAAAVDHLICIHDFEVPFYEPYGLACTVCGHPALGRFKPGDGAALPRAPEVQAERQASCSCCPAAAPAEIRRIGPTLWRAAELLDRDRDDLRLVVVAARQRCASRCVAQAPPVARIVDEREKEDAFAAATVALAASGTVTTEVALQGTPLVIGYKLGWITWALARAFLFKVEVRDADERRRRRGGRAGIAADASSRPRTSPPPPRRLLDDRRSRAKSRSAAQDEALAKMGRGGTPAAEIAADAVLKVMRDSAL